MVILNCRLVKRIFAPLALLATLLVMPGAIGPANAQELLGEKQQSQKVLAGVNREISLGEEKKRKLQREIASLKKDRTVISKALVVVAERTGKLESRLDEIEKRLGVLGSQESEIRQSLHGRRNLLSKVLAALQRMGRKPPPALLIRPDDALASIRSAVILGAVVPELRAETSILITDLKELARLRANIIAQKQIHASNIISLSEEDARLSLLVDEKLKLVGKTRQALDGQNKKARKLAEKATSLKQLIASLSAQIEDAELAARKAREAEDARSRAEDERLSIARNSVENGDAKIASQFGRIVQFSRFSEAKGSLRLPVRGVEVVAFGEKTTTGSRSNGAMMATRANALVISPFDAKIVYAGPFRSYGQLLILDVGEHTHIVMAGMDRINVGRGQLVLAGEPVAKMGTRRIASVVAQDIASSRPMLYVEFRKDGKSFDPTPWWAESSIKRSGNDS